MTEDQKAMSIILELLAANRGIPMPAGRLQTEARYLGWRNDLAGVLALMEERGLVQASRDALGQVRYCLTKAGKEALNEI